MWSVDRQVDDRVALWIEGDRTDVGPIARVARPARGVALFGLEVQGVASRQDGPVIGRNGNPRYLATGIVKTGR